MIANFRPWLERTLRLLVGTPAPLIAASVALAAMSASSAPRPDVTAAAGAPVLTGERDLQRVLARLDPATRSLVLRHETDLSQLYGLTPGWESVSLAGKPRLELGQTGVEAQRLNAALPAVIGALRSVRAFPFAPASEQDRARALRCLTQAVYYEAALEPTEGQAAVAQVVLNRVRDPNYPNSVCGVVYEGAERVTGCQFSFTCDGSLARTPVGWAWDRARRVAEQALAGHVATRVGTSTHYHADYVYPRWAPSLTKIDQIGAHIFYRWKGRAGETAAFRQAYSGREPFIDEGRFARPRIASMDTQAAAANEAAEPTVDASGNILPPTRTVTIAGHTREVSATSLGGRRMPTRDEVAAINARIRAFEVGDTPPADTPPGVTPMDVEEVGRPTQ